VPKPKQQKDAPCPHPLPAADVRLDKTSVNSMPPVIVVGLSYEHYPQLADNDLDPLTGPHSSGISDFPSIFVLRI